MRDIQAEVKILNDPTEKQIKEMVDMTVNAFATETSINAMTGGLHELQVDLFQLSVRATALEGKIVVCQEPESNRILSIGMCFGPGIDFLGSEAQRALGWEKFWAKVPTATKKWWNEVNRPLSKKLIEETIGEQKLTDSWFITVMATLPSERHKGYGSAIVQRICEMASETNSISALNATSDSNVSFYGSLGFKVVGSGDRPSPFGTWTNSIMLWESQRCQ